MLDDIISANTGDTGQAHGRRVALIVRRVARIVAVPALLLMLGGLLAYGIGSGWLLRQAWAGLPGPGTVVLIRPGDPPGHLFSGEAASGEAASGEAASGEAAMSLGLLALALVPAITVFLILLDHLRDRRWKEAAVAASVVAIMAFSAVLGKK